MKKELAGYGISIDDDHISKFAKVVHGISQKGYAVGEVIKEFSDLESTRKAYEYLKALIPGLERRCDALNQECSILQEHVKSCKHLPHILVLDRYQIQFVSLLVCISG